MTQHPKIWSILQTLNVSNHLVYQLYKSIVDCTKYVCIEIIDLRQRMRPLAITKRTSWKSIQTYANDHVHKSCEVQLFGDRGRNEIDMSGPLLSTIYGDIMPSVRNWKQLAYIQYKKRCIDMCSYNSDGTRLALGCNDQTIRILDMDETSEQFGRCTKVLNMSDSCRCVVYHPTKPFLASSHYLHIRIWNVDETSEHFGTYTTIKTENIHIHGHIFYNADGTRLISCGVDHSCYDHTSELIRKTYYQLFTTTILNSDEHSQSYGECVKMSRSLQPYVNSVCFHPNGTHIASGGSDHTVCIWNVDETSEKFGTGPLCLHGHEWSVRCLQYSPNGRFLASGSEDKTVRIWNVDETSDQFKTCFILNGHTRRVTSISYSPNGRFLASGSEDNTIRIWNVDPRSHLCGTCVKLLLISKESYSSANNIVSVHFHPNGTRLISRSPTKILTFGFSMNNN